VSERVRRAAAAALVVVVIVVAGPAPVHAAQGSDDAAAEAREEARRILDQPRFKPPPHPRPLRGVFRWLGERFEPVGDRLEPLGRPFAYLFRVIAGSWVWSLATGGVVALLAALVTLRLARRRGRGLTHATGRRRDRMRDLDPDALEREADAAEVDGRFDEAFRLRFLAGLVRLDRAGVVELRPSLTSGALRRRVPSAALRGLTVRFDEIVYGGQPAGPEDVDQARREWPRALEQVGS
jgi:hypothetical protein